MNPRDFMHGLIETNFVSALKRFVDIENSGKILTGGIGIQIGKTPATVRSADIVFISNEKLKQNQARGFLTRAPELVVEIVSCANDWNYTYTKIKEYFLFGVNSVWVIDLKRRVICIFKSVHQVHELTSNDTIYGDGILQGFKLKIAQVFQD